MASVDKPETSKPTEASQQPSKSEGESTAKQGEDKREPNPGGQDATEPSSSDKKDPPAPEDADEEESSDDSEPSEDEFPLPPGFIPRGRPTGPVAGGSKGISKPRPTRP